MPSKTEPKYPPPPPIGDRKSKTYQRGLTLTCKIAFSSRNVFRVLFKLLVMNVYLVLNLLDEIVKVDYPNESYSVCNKQYFRGSS